MSSFWDNLIVPNSKEVKPVETSSFWASIMSDRIYFKSLTETKPVKQSKVKAKASKVVAKAEQVYETIEGLVVPADDCKHHWIIPSNSAWAIGVCNVCNGEKWFSNRYKENNSTFNDTIISTPTATVEDIEETLKRDSDIKDIVAVYNNSIGDNA